MFPRGVRRSQLSPTPWRECWSLGHCTHIQGRVFYSRLRRAVSSLTKYYEQFLVLGYNIQKTKSSFSRRANEIEEMHQVVCAIQRNTCAEGSQGK